MCSVQRMCSLSGQRERFAVRASALALENFSNVSALGYIQDKTTVGATFEKVCLHDDNVVPLLVVEPVGCISCVCHFDLAHSSPEWIYVASQLWHLYMYVCVCVRVCVCVCVCMYIYIVCVSIHTYIHTNKQTHTHTHTHTWIML